MALTDVQVRKAKATGSPFKLFDGGGLFLMVTAKGFRSWRLKYRFGGKERLLVIGPYPEITIVEARNLRDEARRQLRANIDPGMERKRARFAAVSSAQLTFEVVAREWQEAQAERWAPHHASDVLRSLERDIFPDLGRMPIAEIDAPIVLATLRKIEKRGSIETARRVRQRVSAVFVHAIATGIARADPAAIVANALKPLVKKGRQPALTNVDEARQVLVAAEASGATPIVKLASRLLALTAVRPGVIRGAQWAEIEGIDWATGEGIDAIWRVPASRMKLVQERKDDAAFEHVVPLVPAAVEVLTTVRRLSGRAPFIFPSQRQVHQPLSENAIGYLYNRVGFHGRHVPHGWRAAFSTTMNGIAVKLGRVQDAQMIEMMLAHVPENKVRAAYDRALHDQRRREIAQEWADLLLSGLGPAAAIIVDR